MQAVAISKQGTKTDKNQDAYLALIPQRLFLVADGVGGGPSGEFASRAVVSQVYNDFAENPVSESALIASIQKAGKIIFTEATNNNLKGMATTFACAFVNGDQLSILHAGDSRIYRIRDQKLSQLTSDHAKHIQKQDHSIKLVVTNALGIREETRIDVDHLDWVKGDKLLLTTDGITDPLNDEIILNILTNNNRLLVDRVNDLIQEAARQGGKDDKTALLAFEPEAAII